MSHIKYTIIACLMLLIIFSSCTTSIRYIAPEESSLLNKAEFIIVQLNDGTEIELKKPYLEKDRIRGFIKKDIPYEIPVSSIQSVRIKSSSFYYGFLYTGVAATGSFLFIGSITAPSPPSSGSCPFIYSFDGSDYVLDAEPYGGAVCQSLERSEWCALEHLKEVNGSYKIMITNELNEIEYIDEVKLVVVDHAKEFDVVPGPGGRFHTFSRPVNPVRACNKNGNDILPLISGEDSKSWEPHIEGKIQVDKEDLKEELILEFPKPEHAKKVKLRVNACTTQWGSLVAAEFLKLYGSGLSDWYKEVNHYGFAFHQIIAWYLREELYLLHIRVETESGWKTKGLLYGGGPFMSEDKAYILDIRDVPGDTLRIKLTPPVNFWIFNYFSVDYSMDIPVDANEIRPVTVIDHKGRDVQEMLMENDNTYLVMLKSGDWAEAVFPVPPQPANTKRTVFLKASGYYNACIKGKGNPQAGTIKRINNEPGYTLLFAWEEYLKWKKKEQQKITSNMDTDN
ncbi:MAG: hypothetical protein JXB88_25010 [Spirochaetales bacterium]|nr:hypothetical protein [Spirochaetales bacterium]